jgi:hypothetical protein
VSKRERKVRLSLEEQLARANADMSAIAAARDKLQQRVHELEKAAEAGRKDRDDLKERLAKSENSNQFMRGYVARAQEDDVAREELVSVGDPDGHRQLMPKRKHVEFPADNPYQQPEVPTTWSAMAHHHDERPRSRHWVTY